ncbi:hypothetical protein ALC57_12410 [Trachymyrmex cornetzi]|uniref:Uncharacterized protein n=1 Tax=Trachymyrmex cornetzi TaxID=471704 RepID=A0A195DR92_9HYME|nr:hypothetical protein ALC57_12410 [Trachymyrmex cornetzi]
MDAEGEGQGEEAKKWAALRSIGDDNIGHTGSFPINNPRRSNRIDAAARAVAATATCPFTLRFAILGTYAYIYMYMSVYTDGVSRVVEGRRNRCTRQRDADRRAIPFFFSRPLFCSSSSSSTSSGRESLPNSPTMGSRPEHPVYSICTHRGPGIENTIWRAQVYSKAIRTRSHEFTLIRFGIYVVYWIYYFEHDSVLFGTGSVHGLLRGRYPTTQFIIQALFNQQLSK